MTNPPYILEHLQQIADILCDPRVFSYLHVPVRGGHGGGEHHCSCRSCCCRVLWAVLALHQALMSVA
jgi:hypothetical protein